MLYTIKKGDSLSAIAARLTIGGSGYAKAIANVNNITNPNLIKIGQSITIPDNWLKSYNPVAINPTQEIAPMVFTLPEVNVKADRIINPPTLGNQQTSSFGGLIKSPLFLLGVAGVIVAMFLMSKDKH